MGRLREANVDVSSAFYQEKRKAIVDMAALTFQERGYAATSIGMIAEKLGSDRASIYYYFGSKEELFHTIVREVAQQAVESAEAIAAGARDVVRVCEEGGCSLLLCEQNIWFSRRCTDFVYVLDSGRLVFSGTWEQFDATEDVRKQYLGVA